jgi:hypothetical protein
MRFNDRAATSALWISSADMDLLYRDVTNHDLVLLEVAAVFAQIKIQRLGI